MFQLIDTILQQFKKCFKRKATWNWFVVIIIGFMIRKSHRGVTSMISDMRLNPKKYHTMMHFFRSKAYEVDEIYETWIGEVVKDPAILRISDRVVTSGDHTKLSKEGRKMPDIQIIRNSRLSSYHSEIL